MLPSSVSGSTGERSKFRIKHFLEGGGPMGKKKKMHKRKRKSFLSTQGGKGAGPLLNRPPPLPPTRKPKPHLRR